MRMLHTLLLGAFWTALALADCCPEERGCHWVTTLILPPIWKCDRCGDGTNPTPCCGHGKCNAFCCACDGGYRGSSSTGSPGAAEAKLQAAFEHQTPLPATSGDKACSYDTTFDSIDADNDGAVSLAEYLVWVNGNNPAASGSATLLGTWIDYFNRFDNNGDGQMQFDEMHRPSK